MVVPLTPAAAWAEVKTWCRAFAELMGAEQPAQLSAEGREGGAARAHSDRLAAQCAGGDGDRLVLPARAAGRDVATPLAWAEVTPKLDPGAFTIQTVPARIAQRGHAPWKGFEAVQQRLPEPAARPAVRRASAPKPSATRIVHAPKPRTR